MERTDAWYIRMIVSRIIELIAFFVLATVCVKGTVGTFEIAPPVFRLITAAFLGFTLSIFIRPKSS